MKNLINIASGILPLIAVAFIISQILFTNELAEITTELHGLDTMIAALTDENISLEQKVASESSISAVTTKAKELGFTEAKKIVTLSEKDFQVALQMPK